jgi:hypothetical protein
MESAMKYLWTFVTLLATALAAMASDAPMVRSLQDYQRAEQHVLSQYKLLHDHPGALTRESVLAAKMELHSIKSRLRQAREGAPAVVQAISSQLMANNFMLVDGYIYAYTSEKNRIVTRIKSISREFTENVRLEFKFYKNGSITYVDDTGIDGETYGYYGVSPYRFAYTEDYVNKVDYDSLLIYATFDPANGSDDIFWDDTMEILENVLAPTAYNVEWYGRIRNTSGFDLRFPIILASMMNGEAMLDYNYTFLDVTDYTLKADSIGLFDSYLELPAGHDGIRYYPMYAMSLSDIPGGLVFKPNLPQFEWPSYKGNIKTSIPFRLYLLDHESEPIQIYVDWGDGTPLQWSGNNASNSVVEVGHAYAKTGSYRVRSKSRDATSGESVWSDSVMVEVVDPTGVEERPSPVVSYDLAKNYPNPFNAATVIRYDLPAADRIRLTVCDVRGRMLQVLEDGEQAAGRHSVRFDGSGLASGIYFCRLEGRQGAKTIKMVLAR